MKRFAPVVDAAYGMPRYTWTPLVTTPRPLPSVVSTTADIDLSSAGLSASAAPATVGSTIHADPNSDDLRRARRLTSRGLWLIFSSFEGQIPPTQRYLISRNSSRPYLDPSRPRPDSFMPPNGATSVEMIPVLIPTMPYSSASATRQTRPMSRP